MWSLPEQQPPALAAAVSEDSAAWAATWADGLITVGSDPQTSAAVRTAYRGQGGRGERALQLHVSLAGSREEALAIATDQWRHATVPQERMWEIEQPKQLDAEAEPTPEAIEGAVAVAGSPEELADRIAQEAEGFDAVYLHHVGKDQTYFLDHAPALLARRRSAL